MAGDVDPEVGALFDLPADEFVAARDALAKARRAAGDREAAAAVKQLRRPTLSAWALNQLARRHPDDVRTLVEQGAALAEAQEQALAGAQVDLRKAGRARTDTLRRLTRAADGVLGGRGSAAHRDEVVATLTAASSDPVSGAVLLGGRLSEPFEAPSGFGGPFAPTSVPAAPTTPAVNQVRATTSAGARSREEPGPSPRRAEPSSPPPQEKKAKGGDDARAATGASDGGREQEEAPTTAGEREPALVRATRVRRRRGAAEAREAEDAAEEVAPEDGVATAGSARVRAPLRAGRDRGGRPARRTPAEGSRARVSAADDRTPARAARDRRAGGATTSQTAAVAEAAEAAAAEAQADAARAAVAAHAVAERVAALEEELAQARAALAEAEQEAGRCRRAAAAAAEAAQAAAQQVAGAEGRGPSERPATR